MSQATQEKPDPIGLAIICNSVPPYRIHVHQRIVREMPEVKLWTVCTHEGTDARWKFDPPAEINTVSFGLEPGIPDRHGLNWASYRKGGRIIEWLKQNDIRAVVVLGYNDPGRVRIIRWCRRNRIPCFLWGDSNIRLDRATGLKAVAKKLFVGRIMSWLSGALTCGQYGRAYHEKYGMPPERIFHFPNEPDYDLITGISPQRIEQMRVKYGLAPNRRRFVYSGRFLEIKRPQMAVKAFVRIADQVPEWDLLMIGDGEMKPEMLQMIPPALESRVTWTGHQSDQADVAALYHSCDALVLPSWYEAWALVVNEAAAAGLAIVCSDVVGASAELVRDGVNGRLFPPDDLDAACRCLLDVAAPGRIDAMKSASPMILDEWRRRADPIDGLRAALTHSGVLPPRVTR